MTTTNAKRRPQKATVRPTEAQLARAIDGPARFLVLPEEGLVVGPKGFFVGRLTPRGYLRCYVGDAGRPEAVVHRIVWESVNGPVPDGLEINHINGIKTDNRISNLELVTHTENVRHAKRIGLTTYRLDMKKAIEIRRRHSAGESRAAIAVAFGVTESCIGQVLRRVTWAHATEGAR